MTGRAAGSPAVSVIIPTYNRSALVAKCIESLRQGGIRDLEIVVVDDGGTDDTERVATGLGARYVRQVNAGPAAARNNGFRGSSGRYVTFIDSDDEWLPDAAGRLLAQIDAAADIDLIFGDAAMGNAQDGFVSFVRTYGGDAFFALPHGRIGDGVRAFDRRPFLLQLSTRNVMFLGSMLIRRDFFAKVGAFDETLRGAADWEFFMRSTVAGKVAFSEGPSVSRYYKHDQGMSTDFDHMEEEFIRALDAVRQKCALDPVERRHIDERLREHVFGWAWVAYDKGNHVVARERLRRASAMGHMGTRERAYLALTYLPPNLVGALRRTRQALFPST